MYQIGTSLLTLLVAAAGVNGYEWTRCLDAPRCILMAEPNQSTTTGGISAGGMNYPGGYVFAYDSCTDFQYDTKDGYWYSHEVDGLLVSPAGFLVTAHDCNMVVVRSKWDFVGSTYWMKYGGGNCCLPDTVGTNIGNVGAYYTGAN